MSMGSVKEVPKQGERYVRLPKSPVPQPVTIEARGLVAMVVDMQRDFVREGGKLFVGPSAPATVTRIHAVLDHARKRKVPIIYTQDWHPEGSAEFAIWGPHCIVGTRGAEIVDELAPLPGDTVVRKTSYDPFFGTDLDKRLLQLGVGKAIVMGTVSSICVLHAVAGLVLRGVKPYVPVDCISSIARFDEVLARRQITFLYKGVLTTSDGLKIA